MTASLLKANLTRENVMRVLETLGYEFDRNGKFKLRDERTPSSAINPRTGRIKDFGSDWSGDIFDVLQEYHGMTFPEAKEYVAGVLGLKHSDIEARAAPVFTQPKPPVPRYDVRRIYEQFRRGRDELVRRLGKEEAAKRFGDELVPKPLQQGMDRDFIDEMVGFDIRNDSFTVSLLEGDEVKAVTIRRADDVKWKTYGSKKFIATYFDDSPFAYVVYGMKEIVLLSAHGWPFIGFQADSIAKSIERNEQAKQIKVAVEGKVLILLLDNDESCRETVEPLRAYFDESVVVAMDFQKLLFDQALPKGYDFFDFAAWCESMDTAKWMIEDFVGMVPPHDIDQSESQRSAA